MKYRPYVIEVSDNVLAKEGNNYAQGWTSCSIRDDNLFKGSHFIYEPKTHSVIGDLFFDKKLRAVPYAVYVAEGSVGVDEGATPNTGLTCCPGFYPSFAYYEENIMDVRTCLDINVDIKVKD